VNLSGRGDKDIGTVADLSHGDFFCRPSCQGQSVKGGVVVEQPVKLVKNGALSDAGPPQGAKAPSGGSAAHEVASVGVRS
jgi:hypothetical protein